MENVKNIRTLLIANRGEIAVRIQRTAHDMGIRTVAIYAESDVNAPFAKSADLAIPLKGRTSAETYLDIQQILHACQLSGADAVHPGYGFLSENAAFAQAVIDAGLIWVGPSVEAIAKMGDKLAAKQLMEQADVPVLSGIKIDGDSDYKLHAEKLGYPILVKAAAGGGGRGMRIVECEAELDEAIASSKREAKASFGDDTVFLERWLTSTRHIEIQILGDTHGNIVYCFERECSIQRRHQKIIEEAPSPAVTNDVRKRMGEAAVAAAKSIGYYSTGTIEFLLSGDSFYFLEVNTRLQVEHPVTEEITGLDLVREQLRIAQGESLGFTQEDLTINGHAIEARLYAEDPANNFLPAPGEITVWQPSLIKGARIDTGVEAGSEISIEFDPMIAKVIVHAPTRSEAATKLRRVLETTRLQGLTSNKQFLIETLSTPEFLAADTTTDFIARVQPKRESDLSQLAIHRAAIAVAMEKRARRQTSAKVLTTIPRGWRNSKMPPDITCFAVGGNDVELGYQRKRNGDVEFDVMGEKYAVHDLQSGNGVADLVINDTRIIFKLTEINQKWFVHSSDGSIDLREKERFEKAVEVVTDDDLTAPMPSLVQKVDVKVGDIVQKSQTLIIVESMKMELKIVSPRDGIVSEVKVKQGDNVDAGQVLVSLEELFVDDANAAKDSSDHAPIKEASLE